MKAQTGQKIGGYTLENLELEFESVDSQELLMRSSRCTQLRGH